MVHGDQRHRAGGLEGTGPPADRLCCAGAHRLPCLVVLVPGRLGPRSCAAPTGGPGLAHDHRLRVPVSWPARPLLLPADRGPRALDGATKRIPRWTCPARADPARLPGESAGAGQVE
jgi:hypothetical protein